VKLEDIKLTRVTSVDDVLDMLAWLGERREWLSVDIETTGLNVGRDKIRLAQFGDETQGWALDYSDYKGVVREVIESYDRPMVAWNMLFETKMFKADGIVIPQRLAHDAMVMAFLNRPDFRMDLKGNAARDVDKRALAGQGLLEQAMSGGGWDWDTIPTDHPAYWQYGVLDTCLTSMLASKLYPGVISKYREAYELEMGVIHCIREAELNGLLTDPNYIVRAKAKLQEDLDACSAQLPDGYNPNADRQTIEFLQSIGAKLFVLTEKGNLSTDKNVLKYLANNGFPIAAVISEYKSKHRMLHSYLEKFEELAVDHVLHASARTVGAKTGRMSITDPPLQTLPRGRIVRDAIITREGHRLCMADFTGMEMRALAADAREPGMLAAYDRGEDLHNYVATQIYGAGFTKLQRATAKNSGFAKIYGAGIEQFAVTAGISVDDAKAFMEKYDALFPGVSTYMQRVVNSVMQRAGGDRKGKGYVKLIDGRELPVPAEKAYVAVNYRIQGSTAVAMKRKMIELDNAGLGPYFRLPVHDEFLFEVPDDLVPAARNVIKTVMPDHYSFPGVVLEIDQDEVDRWGQHYRGDEYPKYVETEDPEWLQ
jgi:DNA polymerase-1